MYQFIVNILPFIFKVRVMPDGCVRIVLSWRTTEVEFFDFPRISWSKFDMDGTYSQYTVDSRRYFSICVYMSAEKFGNLRIYDWACELRNEFKRVCAAYAPALSIVETYDVILGRLLTDKEDMNPE